MTISRIIDKALLISVLILSIFSVCMVPGKASFAADNAWSVESIPNTAGKLLAPGTDVSDFAFDSDNTTVYLVDQEAGKLKKSADGGVYWFRDYTPGYGHSLASSGTDRLVTGSVNGYISYSTDGRATWTDIQPQIEMGALQTQVTASGLSNEDYIYAASAKADSKVWRWRVGSSDEWEDLSAPVPAGYGVYGLKYYDGALYVVVSDNTSSSELLRAASTAGGSPQWSDLGTVADTLNYGSDLQVSSGSAKLWAIGTSGDALYSYTYTPAPSPSPPGGGGGGGGGGPSGVTSFVGMTTGAGKFVQDVEGSSADGKVIINIPEDAIGLNKLGQPLRTISIKPMTDPPTPPGNAAIIGLTYDLGPAGATFDPPVTITLKYDPPLLPEGVSESNLRLATWDAEQGQWIELECTVDPGANTITAQLAHFSAYTIIAGTAPSEIMPVGLDIIPAEVSPGGEVTFSVTLENKGDLSGTEEITLLIDGHVIDTREVKLEGGAADSIEFYTIENLPGVHRVVVGEMSGEFMVRTPAAFVVSNMLVQPTECSPGETVTVTLTVQNTGGMEGVYAPFVDINGETEAQPGITVAAAGTTKVIFTINKTEPGIYTVKGGELAADFHIIALATPSTSEPASTMTTSPAPIRTTPVPVSSHTNWVLIGVIVVFVLGAGTLVFGLVRRRH